MEKDHLLWLREGREITTKERLLCIINLSIPAILAQISTVAMHYIDASMVGKLGASASASIGLVTSTTWLLRGITTAAATGFTVQVAHQIGAKCDDKARGIVKHGLFTVIGFGFLMTLITLCISGYLPVWLGGGTDILVDATNYFRIYCLALPALAMSFTAGGMLQCSGDMRVPSMLNIAKCVLDIVFNALLIFPSSQFKVGTIAFHLPGMGLGVTGAALGTLLAEYVCAFSTLYFLMFRSQKLHWRHEKIENHYIVELKKAVFIAIPIAVENIIVGGARIMSTKIVAPLGNVSIAADSFSVTVEGLCYMPGYGIGTAATALIGQSIGARRTEETKKLSWGTVGLGMAVMTGTGILMYVFAPQMLALLTPSAEIRQLGIRILRIEAFAEPLFAASIVVAGVFRGAGKTTISTVLNLGTMWLIRIPLAAFLAPRVGLTGVWTAMCIQLIVCGVLFLIAMYRWVQKENIYNYKTIR